MIMMQGPTLPDILKIMQTTIQTIDNWCKKNRLKISKDIGSDANVHKKQRST